MANHDDAGSERVFEFAVTFLAEGMTEDQAYCSLVDRLAEAGLTDWVEIEGHGPDA